MIQNPAIQGGGGAETATVKGNISFLSSATIYWDDGISGRSMSISDLTSPIEVTKNSLLVISGYEPRGEGYPIAVSGCELFSGGEAEKSTTAFFHVFGVFEIA